jgi:murein DD-endopeptidase MepM/ murein hydrolase activator NlpD
MHYLLATLLIPISIVSSGCFGFGVPDGAQVVRSFAPIGRWAGHWGVDIASPSGSAVPAIGAGVVRFAGVVVRNTSVSIDHGGGLVTSYSYLAVTTVEKGDRVARGTAVGVSGVHDGVEAFHLSLRVDGRYLDPMALRRCRSAPFRGLYLAVRPATYAIGRARDP